MTKARTLGEAVDAGEPLTQVFDLVRQLAEKKGYIPIGFRRIALPDGWIVTVNGTNEPRDDEEGFTIQPFEASVIKDGWLRGCFGMFNGGLVGHGTEEQLIAAFEKALAE